MRLSLLLLIAVAACARPIPRTGARSASVEQPADGNGPAPVVIASFDGLGVGFEGPQGTARAGNPSDNSLAVGRDHIVQTVNSRMAIFTKRGSAFDTTGRVLYGPVSTNNVFRGFGGDCEARNNGDAVVRYDQLADRWLLVMPIFTRLAWRADQPVGTRPGDAAAVSVPAVSGQPGPAAALYQPPPSTDAPAPRPATTVARGAQPSGPQGVYAMCYAISASPDPMGAWYRYEFLRPYFPDYPRPAVWPDGYYVPSSTGDDRISPTVATQKHACVVERAKMLRGEPASEQCLIVENVNFLNNADLDGTALPPPGAPNPMIAAGGTQLDSVLADSVIHAWSFHVDWREPARTRITGPSTIAVAPYHYLCNGQLTNCVPQPGTDRHLDAQGDKIMARVVYRRIGDDGFRQHRAWRWCRSVVRAAGWRRPRLASPPAGHLSGGYELPLDGQSGDGPLRQHRHRLLIRRSVRLSGTAVRRPPSDRPRRHSRASRGRPCRWRSVADEYAPLGGLHADGHRSLR